MAKKGTGKQISQAVFFKRLAEISQIEDDLLNNRTVKASNLSKVGYILWKNKNARDRDITLALDYYRTFHKDLVTGDIITFDNLYKLPKMYDIQRDRAKIQNEYKLFPASMPVQQKRKLKSEEYKVSWENEKNRETARTAEYSLFFDESGKEETNFILASIALNEIKKNSDEYKQELNEIRNELINEYNLREKELKFTNINTSNLKFYKKFIEKIFYKEYLPMFFSISIDQRGLSQKTKKKKTDKLLIYILFEALCSIIQKATENSTLNSYIKLNLTLDEDGKHPDISETKEKEYDIQNELNKHYKYLVQIDKLQYIKSDDDILVQLADLYSSSLNNVFSDKKTDSNTAKAKKDFAEFLLKKVGIKSIDDRGDSSTIYMHRPIMLSKVKTDDII